jgi:aryl-phospho-beta-D-glucosidase BglC (GH1 family)
MDAQDFLQQHFIEAMKRVAQAVADSPNVLGFDTLNEPDQGWIGRRDVEAYVG